MIYSSYMGAWNEFKLSVKLNQFPIFKIEKNKFFSQKKIDKNLRKKLDDKISSSNKFESFVINSLKDFFPKVFLENFVDLKNFTLDSNLPKNPKKVISANALWYDSFFMFYTARLMENGTKLIYAQHGGAYGIAKYSWPEEHEKRISDKYLSWGWSRFTNNTKVKKFFVTLKKKDFKWENNKMVNLLFLMKHRKVYFQSPETSAGTELFSDYTKYCNDLFISLSENIRQKIILRYPFKNLKIESQIFFQH